MITRRNPFREMMSMRDAMDRMMSRNFLDEDWLKPIAWDLALDVAELADEFVVKASVPGINPDDLEITYNNNVLSIKGETKADKDVNEEHYHLRERRFGSFCRSISLPSTVKADAISANYEAGVLTLHLPKAEEAKPKRIPISGGADLIEGKVSSSKNN